MASQAGGDLLQILRTWREKHQPLDTIPRDVAPEEVLPLFELYNKVSFDTENKNLMSLYDGTRDLWVKLGDLLSNEVERLYFVAATTSPADHNKGSDGEADKTSNSEKSSSDDESVGDKIDFNEQWLMFHGQIYQLTFDMLDSMPHMKNPKDDPQEFTEYKRRFCIAVIGKIKTQLTKCYEAPGPVQFEHDKVAKIKRIFVKYFNKMFDVWWEDSMWFRPRLEFTMHEQGKEVQNASPAMLACVWKLFEIAQLSTFQYHLIFHFDVEKLETKSKWTMLTDWRDSVSKELMPLFETNTADSWANFPFVLYNYATWMAALYAEQHVSLERRNLVVSEWEDHFNDMFTTATESFWDNEKKMEKEAMEKQMAEEEEKQKEAAAKKPSAAKKKKGKSKGKGKKNEGGKKDEKLENDCPTPKTESKVDGKGVYEQHSSKSEDGKGSAEASPKPKKRSPRFGIMTDDGVQGLGIQHLKLC